MIVTITLTMSQIVGNKFKMSKKNQNEALKFKWKNGCNCIIKNEPFIIIKIGLYH
jgi:hypothetical protein